MNPLFQFENTPVEKIITGNTIPKSKDKIKDPFLIQNKIIFKKYHPIKQIGHGTFSTVYLALVLNTNKYVAIKAEKKSKDTMELLKHEAFILCSLRGLGIPEVLSYGKTKYHNILVMPLLGKSLLEIFILNPGNININDICLSSIQILDRIEWVHTNNIVYRDIKPENFLFGKNDNNILYLIDFGLCRKFRSEKTGKHISPKNLGKFTGTSRYASIYAMAGNEQSRRDDIESIGYMIIFFLKKKLPWQGIRGNSYKECYHKLFLMKKHMNLEILCRGLPVEMMKYMKYAKSLKFEQEPNYQYLKNLFREILNKCNITMDKYVLSWCKKNEKKININMNTNNFEQKILQRKSKSPNNFYNLNTDNLDYQNKTRNQYSQINNSNNSNNINAKNLTKIAKTLVSKDLQSINNIGQINSAGINLNLGRINSDKNIYSDKFFIHGINNDMKGYPPQNNKISQLMSYNHQFTEKNNFNNDEKFNRNYSSFKINNNTNKIISINPINENNHNNVVINIDNKKIKYNKISQITRVDKHIENNNHQNNSKEKIIYNTFNTYNNINNIITPLNNNNSYINNIYKRSPDITKIINYQNYNYTKKNNIQNNTKLDYKKAESFIKENKNILNNNLTKNNNSYININHKNKDGSITGYFYYKNYQNQQNQKKLNSYKNINSIRKINTSLNKNKIITITPNLNLNSNKAELNNFGNNKIHHYNSYIVKARDTNNYKNRNYSNLNPFTTNDNNKIYFKNNSLKITKYNNNKINQNNITNENRSINFVNNLSNKMNKNFSFVGYKTKNNNKTLDNNSYYINGNKFVVNNNLNNSKVSYDNRNNKIDLNKNRKMLNHSLKIIKINSNNSKNKENNLNNTTEVNRINKYKISRNKNIGNN